MSDRDDDGYICECGEYVVPTRAGGLRALLRSFWHWLMKPAEPDEIRDEMGIW